MAACRRLRRGRARQAHSPPWTVYLGSVPRGRSIPVCSASLLHLQTVRVQCSRRSTGQSEMLRCGNEGNAWSRPEGAAHGHVESALSSALDSQGLPQNFIHLTLLQHPTPCDIRLTAVVWGQPGSTPSTLVPVSIVVSTCQVSCNFLRHHLPRPSTPATPGSGKYEYLPIEV